jgi:predicted PurR-regulated permease PerM
VEDPAVTSGPDTRVPVRSSRDAIPFTLRVVAGWSWRILVVLLLAAAVVALIARLKVMFVAVFVALLITALLQPPLARLVRLRVPRILATALVLLVGVAAVIGVVFLAGQAIVAQADELAATLATGVTTLLDWVEMTLGLGVSQRGEYASSLVDSAGGSGGSVGAGVFGVAGNALDVAAGAGVALFATIFFLYDGPRIWSWVTSLFPTRAGTHVEQAGQLSWQTLSGYARGTVLIAAIDAVGIGVGVALIGVPLAVPIGVLVFFASFIPVIGALLSGLAAVLIALATLGWTAALLTVGVVLLVQQLEGHVLQPLIQGRLVAIHPLAVVLAVTAGTIIAGLIGAVIAVPVVAVANVLIRYATHLNAYDDPASAPADTRPSDPHEPLPQPR